MDKVINQSWLMRENKDHKFHTIIYPSFECAEMVFASVAMKEKNGIWVSYLQ